MIWESRRGKSPPQRWLADYLDYIVRTHGVKPTKEMIAEVYGHLKGLWQQGATYREAARATCSVQHGKIILSAGVTVDSARGKLKPPRGAKPGDVFGYDDLRTPGTKAPRAEARKPEKPKPEKPKLEKSTEPDAPKVEEPKPQKSAEPDAPKVEEPKPKEPKPEKPKRKEPKPKEPKPEKPKAEKTAAAATEEKLKKAGLDFDI